MIIAYFLRVFTVTEIRYLKCHTCYSFFSSGGLHNSFEGGSREKSGLAYFFRQQVSWHMRTPTERLLY
jgi:hypothetical protein